MNAAKRNLLDDILGKTHQLLVPVYQRKYSWKKRQCQQLWDDILYAGRSKHKKTHHFMGSVVCRENKIPSPITTITIIDGQQRLTTITLLLVALTRKVNQTNLTVTQEKIRNTYLINPYEKDDTYKHRLILSDEDRESLKALIDNRDHKLSLNIKENFSWFQTEINKLKEEDYEALWAGLRCLSVIEMILDDDDNPQRIFETMNSTGLDLTESDKIRNYILMEGNSDEQNRLYNTYWRPMEKIFGQKNYEKYFDEFVRNYLTMKMSKSKGVESREVYRTFQRFHEKDMPDKDKLLQDMHNCARYYSGMALGDEQDRELNRAFENLRKLKATISYPPLMYLYGEYECRNLHKTEFIEAITMIESYVFRRSVCRLPTSDAGSAMLSMLKAYKTGGTIQMKKRLLGLGGDRLFPWDEMFKNFFKSYQRKTEYWPFRLEKHFCKELLPNEYTIEHIMPQTLTSQWQHALGPKWNEIHEECLNRPGNITLTKHNSNLGNLSYPDKYNKSKVGYKYTKLKINESLKNGEEWNKDTINERSERLAEMAIACWSRPVI